MKKNIIVGVAMAVGVLSIGALSASAAEICNGNCSDPQSVQQFKQETKSISQQLDEKQSQLREQYGYDSQDIRIISTLEAEIKELKAQINASAKKYALSECGRS